MMSMSIILGATQTSGLCLLHAFLEFLLSGDLWMRLSHVIYSFLLSLQTLSRVSHLYYLIYVSQEPKPVCIVIIPVVR